MQLISVATVGVCIIYCVEKTQIKILLNTRCINAKLPDSYYSILKNLTKKVIKGVVIIVKKYREVTR